MTSVKGSPTATAAPKAPINYWAELLKVVGNDDDKPIPVHSKQDKIPVVPNWSYMRWVLVYASIPLVIHQAYASYFDHNLHPIAVMVLYTVAFIAIASRELDILSDLGKVYGFLDGDKHTRDEVPEPRSRSLLIALISTATIRPVLAVLLTYNRDKAPLDLDWYALPIELALYGVTLDFWFYWYHRVMHQFENLWQYHRTHHLTKHPSPLLTLYADHEQEVMDIAGIPLLTFISMRLMGLPMGFYEWWYCHQLIVFAELLGHSGLRVHGSAPSPLHSLWVYLDMDLVIEDHDLHHRTGWKKSHNYGKQTRVWDRIFRTGTSRIESVPANIDYNEKAVMPLF